MHLTTEKFIQSSERAVQDLALRRRLRVLDNYVRKRNEAFAELAEGDELRDRARAIKEHTIANLDRYLLELETSVQRLGGIVHWARDGGEARSIVLAIARANNVKRVVKSKSMVSEEVELNEALEAAGIEAIETDLGEYIVQIAGEKPSHILAPAVHKSKEDISELFAEKLGATNLKTAEEMTVVARRRLRDQFLTADMGITGANFGVAETGSIVLVENEGNIRLSTTLPRVHVALMGIEKVIPRLEDLSVFLRILVRTAGGQKMSGYVSVISGARRDRETDGAGEFHLILLDNGRTRILADAEKRESLYCLRCGACLNVCPVYQKIGGHAYGSVYSGPIGSIITPELASLAEAKDLPFASTLCGACREICPVRINIPHMLLSLRRDWANGNGDRQKSRSGLAERLAIRLWAFAMRNPRIYNLVFRTAAFFQRPLIDDGRLNGFPFELGGWTINRDFPPLAKKSFRSMWAEVEGEEK
jgi:L-lactate dehydrogenase complex protein LldF